MLGYGNYWTAGFSAYQWWSLFNRPNVSEFYFLHLSVERDRMMRSYDVEFYLLGLRLWLCVSWEEPVPEIMEALQGMAQYVQKENPSSLE